MKKHFLLLPMLALGVLATVSLGSVPSASVDAATGALSLGGVGAVPKFLAARVEGGTFLMGAHDNQAEWDDDERPLHNVRLNSYYICKTEVTQELWRWVMNNNPSRFEGKNRPVDNVCWDDCTEFLKRINRRLSELGLPANAKFRLPTEAEWEYAARGGNKSKGYIYSGSNTVGQVAWYNDNADSQTHDVGTKQPNELGIYDMTGNVYEWCADRFKEYTAAAQNNPFNNGDGNVCMRGGAYSTNKKGSRTSYRNYSGTHRFYEYTGLRLVVEMK